MLDTKLLYELLKTPSPSGNEFEIQKKVIKLMEPFVDKVYTHQSMNVINAINPDSKMKVLLAGHIDEISLTVEKVLDNGMVKVCRNGSIRPYMYSGQHVNVIHKENGKTNIVPGVIPYVPNMGEHELKVTDLWVDLGTSSKDETLKLVSIGDPIIHMNDYVMLANNRLSARALDDRLGAYICLEAMKEVKARGGKNGVYTATTVGEETTYRGATFAAAQIKPNCAIIVDVMYVADLPYRENLNTDTKLGGGPVLTIGSEMNEVMKEKMFKVAEKLKMNVQPEASPSQTYTDTDAIYKSYEGVPSYLISIPLRYMHSSVEVCDLKDVEDIIHLIAEFILELDENETFNPFDK